MLTDLGTRLKAHCSLPDALAKYDEALALCPTFAPAHYNRGVLLGEAGRTAEAAQAYSAAIAAAPSHAESHCNLGVLHKHAGDLAAAVMCYERALCAAPTLVVARANLAVALTDLGTQRKAQASAPPPRTGWAGGGGWGGWEGWGGAGPLATLAHLTLPSLYRLPSPRPLAA